jgi:hypothetical protein
MRYCRITRNIPLLFLSEWCKFNSKHCRKNSWWDLAFRSCWNSARRLTCFLSSSVTREVWQFGTWTNPSFKRHYRFRPTTWEVRRNEDMWPTYRMCSLYVCVCECLLTRAYTLCGSRIESPWKWILLYQTGANNHVRWWKGISLADGKEWR